MKEKNENNNPAKESFGVKIKKLWNNRRTRSVLIAGGVILLCAILYVTLLLTVLQPEEEEALPTIGNHGEQMSNGRPFVIDPVEVDQVQSIRVKNENGGFHFYRGEDDEFYFEGAEHMLYSDTSSWLNPDVNAQTDLTDVLSSVSITESLMFSARYVLAIEEVLNYNQDLSVYGLDGEGKASMTLVYRQLDDTEVTKTIYYGNRTPSGSSYYVRLEGRDAVYILSDSTVSRCIFAKLEDYFLPQVAPIVSSTVYSEVATFEIVKKGETFLSIRKVTDEEYELNGELYTHQFVLPSGYYPHTEDFPKILENFMAFSGEHVVEWNLSERLKDPEQADEITKIFRLYSLMDQENRWNNQLSYSYEDPAITVELYISERLEVLPEEGAEDQQIQYIYYVYSPAFDCIVEFKAEEIEWIDWDLLRYMDNHSFSITIDAVSTMEFAYSGTQAKFTLTGEGTDLKIASSTGIAVDTENFRQLYKSVLFASIDGYAEEPDSLNEILRLKVTLRDGRTYEYVYYAMTARKSYYTLNGVGEFYINRDYVKQMIYACNGILAGETIEVERKN